MNTKTTMTLDDKLKKMEYVKIDPAKLHYLTDESKEQLLEINKQIEDASLNEFYEEERRWREMEEREMRYFEIEENKSKLKEAKAALKRARDELGSDEESEDECLL